MTETLKPHKSRGLAIVGPYKTIWTDKLFDTPEEAYKYISNFWGKIKWEPKKWELIHAEQTIKVSTTKNNNPFPLVQK